MARSLALLMLVAACGGSTKTPAAPGPTVETDDATAKIAAPTCGAPARTAFACSFPGGGGVAVCLDEGENGLGVLATGAVEVALDPRPADLGDFQLYLYTRALVSYQGLAFVHDGVPYFVFDEYNEEEGSPSEARGIRAGGVEVACAGPAEGALMFLDGWLEPSYEYPGP